MFGKLASNRRAALCCGLVLWLVACGQDGADLADTGAAPASPSAGDAGVAPSDAGTSTVADSSSPVVIASDAGTSNAPSMDSGSVVATPREAGAEAGPVVDASGGVDAGVASDDSGVPPPWATRDDLGKGDGSDVVTIGDSWMSGPLGGAGIQAGLDREGTHYRHYAVTATTLLSGQIPGQYESAKSANPQISTVIMTAGGNDVMFSGGCNTKEACQAISDMISDGLNELWSKMADDGVKDVLYIAYADVAGATPVELRGMAKPVEVCYTGRINCHMLETSSLVTKASDLIDGIHPNTAANTRIAKAALTMMEERKMRR